MGLIKKGAHIPRGPHHFPYEMSIFRGELAGTKLTWWTGSSDLAGSQKCTHVPGSKLLVLGMVIQPLIGNPYNGYINPYYWVEFPIPIIWK